MVILKNVVIDRLIDECARSPVPSGMSRKIFQHTKSKDSVRQLWIDFYIWDMPEDRFQEELKSKDLSPHFIKDLAAAQKELLRSEENIYAQPPPYEKAPTAYHRPDRITGVCCCRDQFEGSKYKHRRDYIREKTSLGTKLAEAKRKVRDLEDQVWELPMPSKKRKLACSLRDGEAPA